MIKKGRTLSGVSALVIGSGLLCAGPAGAGPRWIDPGGLQHRSSVATQAAAARACGLKPAAQAPPRITGLDFTSHRVDVRSKSRTVAVRVTATDNTGVAHVRVTFVSPTVQGHHNQAVARLRRTGGTATDAVFTGTLTVQRYVVGGAWRVIDVSATDRDDAIASLNYRQLGRRGLIRDLTVRSHADLADPVLNALSVSDTTVDTRKHKRSMTVVARAADRVSGVRGVAVVFSQRGEPNIAYAFLKLKSGTRASGRYRARITIPRWVGNGYWDASAFMIDGAQHLVTLDPRQLSDRGFAHRLDVKSRVDHQKPVLSAISSTPATVDVSTDDAVLHVHGTASDAKSGVGSLAVEYSRPGVKATLGARLHRTPGSQGSFRGTVLVPRCTPAGVYRASVFVVDRAFNYRYYSPSALRIMGSELRVEVKSG